MKRVIYILFIFLTLLACLAAVAGFATGRINPEGREWISFPGLIMLPILWVNLLFLIGWSALRSRWAFASLGALLLNGGFIISMFQIRILPKEVPSGRESVKLITYNVNNFDTNGINQLSNISEWLRKENPDIVCLQECPNEHFIRMDSIAKSLSFLPYFCSTRSVSPGSGLAIFSKYPILRFESILYPDSGNKSLFAVLDMDGDSVRLFNNHFQTTSVNAVRPRLYQAYTEKDSREETEAAFHLVFAMKKNFVMRADQADYIRRMIDGGEGSVLVCGDFNDTPASYVYRKVKGNLVDGFRESGTGYGYTFRQLKKMFRIDYILYSPNFKGVSYDSPCLSFSDHNPVVWVGYDR